MKQIIISIALIILIPFFTVAQSTERFIRIVGSSKHEFVSNGVKLDLSISEITENTRLGTKPLSYDSVYLKFVSEIKKLNINESDLQTKNTNFSRSNNSFSKNFILITNDKNIPEKLANLKLEGVQITEIHYTYNNNLTPEIENMLLNAIDNAKRKASKIAQETGMKLGKILNIEDISGGCCGDIKDTKETKTTKSYDVNITFELKD
ncbi:MAG TPA: SIMPL domain-containing protein [Saprospiraceae bacterium]|jgi:uncharacterized protein YggE|nr:SIMPL domain-containing protein [Saprospiraceae bacterium]